MTQSSLQAHRQIRRGRNRAANDSRNRRPAQDRHRYRRHSATPPKLGHDPSNAAISPADRRLVPIRRQLPIVKELPFLDSRTASRWPKQVRYPLQLHARELMQSIRRERGSSAPPYRADAAPLSYPKVDSLFLRASPENHSGSEKTLRSRCQKLPPSHAHRFRLT